MKKNIIVLVALVLFLAGGLQAIEISIGAGINKNYGLSSFFDFNETIHNFNGRTFLENSENAMGFGFNLGIQVSLTKKISINPEFSYQIGNQHYEFEEVDRDRNNESLDVKSDRNFNVKSGGLNIVYNLISLKNSWKINCFAGLNYNVVKSDKSSDIDIENYLGYKVGLGFEFREIKALSLKLRAYLINSFNDSNLATVAGEFGIFYFIK